MTQLSNEDVKLLGDAVAAASQNTIVYASPIAASTLMNLAYIEGNPAMTDAAGNMAFRPTAAGLVALQNLQAATAPTPVPPPAVPQTLEQKAAAIAQSHPGFARGTGFVPPAKAKRAGKHVGKKYDVDSLELGGWIFVPATEAQPNPKKSLASTISAANRKYATFTPQRFFKSFSAEAGQTFGDGSIVAPTNGCYIVRLEPPAPKVETPAA